MTALADVVREKSGSAGLLSIDGMVAAVVGIQTGGTAGVSGMVDADRVWFVDYDGTVITRWEMDEVAGKIELPGNPEHEGLVAQGWNWTLEEIKSLGRPVVVGQLYMTDDGKTRIYMEVEGRRCVGFAVYLVGGEYVIDWGDGSDPEASAVTGTNTMVHTYAKEGAYIVSISCSGAGAEYYIEETNYYQENTQSSLNCSKADFVRRIELGQASGIFRFGLAKQARLQSMSVALDSKFTGSNMFSNHYGLRALVLPPGVTEIPQDMFYRASSFTVISLPPSVTSIANKAFQECFALKTLTIPEGVVTLGTNVFYDCRALEKVYIPDGVTVLAASAVYNCASATEVRIPEHITALPDYFMLGSCSIHQFVVPEGVVAFGKSVFSQCGSLKELWMKPLTPPTTGIYLLSGIPADCVIYVPEESLEAYRAAENWTDFADKMVGVMEWPL